jgi:hypothetical protein
MTRLCVHCGRGSVSRPRNLCWTCYYTPGVKDQHPSTSIYAKRGVVTNGSKPCKPTTALPGTPEKLAVLEQRAENGEALWHPRDGLTGPDSGEI